MGGPDQDSGAAHAPAVVSSSRACAVAASSTTASSARQAVMGGGGAAMIRRIMVLRTGCRQVRKSGRADLAARTLQLAFYTSHLGLSMLGIFADLCRTCL